MKDPWWLLDRYQNLDCNIEDLRKANIYNFPDYTETGTGSDSRRLDAVLSGLTWVERPGETANALKGIIASNLLAGHHIGRVKELAKTIENVQWLALTCPLPCRKPPVWNDTWWSWILQEAKTCSVFVPTVTQDGNAYVVRFDVVVPRTRWPDDFPAEDSASFHGDSVKAAEAALSKLEGSIPLFRVFAEDGGFESSGRSASLGIAMAAWAAWRNMLNDNHPALSAMAMDYLVTGELMDDGLIDKVDGDLVKLDARKFRALPVIGPYSNMRPGFGCFWRGANRWGDALVRVDPRHWQAAEEEKHPLCDVMVALVGRQTFPIILAVLNAAPTIKVYLVHSENETESRGPARRIRELLLKERTDAQLPGVPVELIEMNSKRLHLALNDFRLAIEKAEKEGRVVVNITGGNKLMVMAANNACSGLAPLMYRERFENEYTLITWDSNNDPAPSQFVKERKGLLKEFNPLDVLMCQAPSIRVIHAGMGLGVLARETSCPAVELLAEEVSSHGADPLLCVELGDPKIEVACMFSMTGVGGSGLWLVFEVGEDCNSFDLGKVESLQFRAGLGARAMLLCNGKASDELLQWAQKKGNRFVFDSLDKGLEELNKFCEDGFSDVRDRT